MVGSRDFDVPDKWPETLSKAWELEVGTGYGSPLLEGKRVYLHARIREQEVLWCIDLAKWSRTSGKTASKSPSR